MMSTDRTGALTSLLDSPAPAKTIGICCAARWMPPWSPATEYVVSSGSVAIRSGPYGAACGVDQLLRVLVEPLALGLGRHQVVADRRDQGEVVAVVAPHRGHVRHLRHHAGGLGHRSGDWSFSHTFSDESL